MKRCQGKIPWVLHSRISKESSTQTFLTRVLKQLVRNHVPILPHFPFLQMSAHFLGGFYFSTFIFIQMPHSSFSILHAHQSQRYSSPFVSGKNPLFYLYLLLVFLFLFHLLFFYSSSILMAFSPDVWVARFLCLTFSVICSGFSFKFYFGFSSG